MLFLCSWLKQFDTNELVRHILETVMRGCRKVGVKRRLEMAVRTIVRSIGIDGMKVGFVNK